VGGSSSWLPSMFPVRERFKVEAQAGRGQIGR